jgi:hypothetical protein
MSIRLLIFSDILGQKQFSLLCFFVSVSVFFFVVTIPSWSLFPAERAYLIHFIFASEGGEPNHHCTLPPNVTVEEAIPKEIVHGKTQYSQCKQFVNLSSETNQTEYCPDGWWYDTDMGRTTVTEVRLPKEISSYVTQYIGLLLLN